MKIEVGTKIKLKGENIIVTVKKVSGDIVRYEGDNGERGIILASRLEADQIVEEKLEVKDHHTTTTVFMNDHAAGMTRKIFKCWGGKFAVKFNNELVEVVNNNGQWLRKGVIWE
jgi:hypothetical protein